MTVLGTGPAASVAAFVLARAGARTELLGKEGGKGLCIGETVPPETRAVLCSLGLEDVLTADAHLPSPGGLSRWGSNDPQARDTIINSFGSGWHLDRRHFDAQLLAHAVAAGCRRTKSTGVLRADRLRRGWQLHTVERGRPRSAETGYVLDCTGRTAKFALLQGARRVTYDKLVASWALVDRGDDAPVEDARTHVAARRTGWAYSARVPGRRRAVAVFFDGDLADRHRYLDRDAFLQEVRGPEYAAQRSYDERCTFVTGPVLVAASSTRLTCAHGFRWLAAGDAAQCFDPLSSQGILSAIVSGANAAYTLIRTQGSEPMSEIYQARLDDAFDAYLKERHIQYCRETRWSKEPFWARRHALPTSLSSGNEAGHARH